jgi:hypothetical protein
MTPPSSGLMYKDNLSRLEVAEEDSPELKNGEQIMGEHVVHRPLQGKVALVAGATRGAGRAIAVELCRAGAFVYATGRSSRLTGLSEMDRPETIEDTGELMLATGGEGSAHCALLRLGDGQ